MREPADTGAIRMNKSRRGSEVSEPVRVGHYQLESTIGKGNFSIVKSATHILTKSKVAIKIIEKGSLDDRSVKKLLQEIKIMKVLSHPHIIRLYQVMQTEKLIYLVTEYAEVGEVFDYISRQGRLKEPDASRLFGQMVSAVAYCHNHHIVHRDIKAENLLLDANLNIKIADFGFSNFYTENEMLKTHCGSPPYAAPELFQGKEYYGPTADIWSLGVVLYVLVVGSLPFDGRQSLSNLRAQVLNGAIRFPYFMSRDCEDLIKKMLRQDPQKRISLLKVQNHIWMCRYPSHIINTADLRESISNGIVQGDDDIGHVDNYLNDVMNTNEINETILQHMVEDFKLEREEIVKSIQSSKFDNLSSIYNLLLDKTRKMTNIVPARLESVRAQMNNPENQSNKNKETLIVPVGKSTRRHTVHHEEGISPQQLQHLKNISGAKKERRTPFPPHELSEVASKLRVLEENKSIIEENNQSTEMINTSDKSLKKNEAINDQKKHSKYKFPFFHRRASEMVQVNPTQQSHLQSIYARNLSVQAHTSGETMANNLLRQSALSDLQEIRSRNEDKLQVENQLTSQLNNLLSTIPNCSSASNMQQFLAQGQLPASNSAASNLQQLAVGSQLTQSASASSNMQQFAAAGRLPANSSAASNLQQLTIGSFLTPSSSATSDLQRSTGSDQLSASSSNASNLQLQSPSTAPANMLSLQLDCSVGGRIPSPLTSKTDRSVNLNESTNDCENNDDLLTTF